MASGLPPAMAPIQEEPLDSIDVLCCRLSKIPNEVWRQLPEDVRKLVISKRIKEREDAKGMGDRGDAKPKADPKKPEPNKDKSSLPRQYSKANHVALEEEDDISLDSNQEAIINAWIANTEDDSEDRQVNACTSIRRVNCGTTSQTIEVGISASKRRACLNSLTIPSNTFTAIMDSGADTCILGKGWHVVEQHPTRRVKVVGFDKELATKNNLPIVTAMTVYELPDGDRILLQVNEGVLNKTADHSLMSNYQIAEYGIDMDARPAKHGGEQRMKIGDDVINFKLCHCMVHFNHRSPTQEEMDTLEPIVLTQGEVPWDPQAAEHSTDEAEAFDCEVAAQICQMGHGDDEVSLDDVTEDLVIDPDTAWTYATSHACPAAVEFGADDIRIDLATPHLHRALPAKVDYDKLSKYFLYRPKEVIRKTLENSTQLARAQINYPLKRHIRSRFQMLCRPRLNEVVATDTYFSSVKSVEGYTCAQIFYCCTSNLMEVYGMKQEASFVDSYQDFMRDRGIPHTLRRDNSKTQNKEEVKRLHRDLVIADQFSKPHCQWQNPAEIKGVKNLKAQTQVIMDRVGAPAKLWFLCQEYLCQVHNHCAHPQNGWKSPEQASGGIHQTSHTFCSFSGMSRFSTRTPIQSFHTQRNCQVILLALPRTQEML